MQTKSDFWRNWLLTLNQNKENVLKAYKTLVNKTGEGNDFLGWIEYPKNYDKEEFARIKKAAEKIRSNSEVLVVIGIGGSYLGAKAVIEALNGDLKLGVAIIVLWIIMSLVRQVLEPKIVSGRIGIHPIFTLIAMYTGFKVIGVMGMIVGPIALIIIKSILTEYRVWKKGPTPN